MTAGNGASGTPEVALVNNQDSQRGHTKSETKRRQHPGYDVYPIWGETAEHNDINGLEPGTKYSVQVAAVCQGSIMGTRSRPKRVRTPRADRYVPHDFRH
ncbi:hypothetical protein MRX96_020795 [Rhipicephalus microplus]